MTRRVALEAGWQVARTRAGEVTAPELLESACLDWRPAVVPGTVASALQPEHGTTAHYDADDWWYRIEFPRPQAAAGARVYLRLDGLATLARVFLNGGEILASDSMFARHRIDITGRLGDDNHLAIRFASLDAEIARKRPRPRWRTRLVSQQNLRWFRTTLLGRMPGWTPPVPVVGPWAPVALECVEEVEVERFSVRATGDGTLHVRARAKSLADHPIEAARLRVGDEMHPLPVASGRELKIEGSVRVARAEPWWPHTHGDPALTPCTLELSVGGRWLAAECARVGFRDLSLDSSEGRVRLVVNGVPVFCRGAVWTPMDFRAPGAGDAAGLRRALGLLRDAGLNMLRVGGTMVYESDEFYRLCDELGILVWQDFMFANMDYPVADPAFRQAIEAEARQQVERLGTRACLAAWCGGSEIAQQAAMMGLPAGQWSNHFFDETLPRLCAEADPRIPYFPSTPWGGPLPFHVGTGIAHYYGVGAYRRPLSDVKSAHVRFTTECLGFSNVPDRPTMDRVLDGATPPPHHPRWKAGVPRDSGAGWDFEDVRDHYLRELFHRDPVGLRSEDLERYYVLSRVVSGEVMLRTFSEWRAPRSGCGGALVWFLRDLVPGAGWGIVDATGRPKAAYWYLKRAWQPVGAWITDDGLDGISLHALNESAATVKARIDFQLLRLGRDAIASAGTQVEIPARSAISIQADALVGHFTDSTRAYRFGPPQHDTVVARMTDAATGALISQDFYFPGGLDLAMQDESPACSVEWDGGGTATVTVGSAVLLQSVSVSAPGWIPDDNYFHVAPGIEKRLTLRSEAPPEAFRAELEAINLREPVTLRAARPGRAPP